jgi:transposase-like protein
MQAEVTEDIRTIFNAPDRTTAEAYLVKAVEKYQKIASRLAEWMAANIPEGLTVFSFPTAHRRLIRARPMAWSAYTAKFAAGHVW